MAFRVFSPRPQRLPACGRRSRSFGLGEKTSETWERQPRKLFVRKYRLIRSMFLHGKSNACSIILDKMLRQHGQQKRRRATNATSNRSLEQLRQQAKRRLDGRLSQTRLCTSEDRTKTRRSVLPISFRLADCYSKLDTP